MHPTLLRSVIPQVTRRGRSILPRRNFSSYRRSNGMSVGARFLIGGTGVTLGCGLGYLMCGGSVARHEEKRQELMREAMGHSHGIVDLREKMWSDPMGTRWSDLREKMWSGLREKMWSDRKS